MPGRKAHKGATPVKSRPRATTRRRSKPQPRQRPSRLAIEKALAEALEQQTATGEILRVISSSPNDAQPVFDTIAKSAARLCKAEFCHVFRFDGEHLHFAAHHGLSPKDFEVAKRAYPMKPGRGTAAARSILSGAIEQIPDVLKDREFVLGAFSKRVGQRSVVAVPMLKQGSPIGSIAVVRGEPGLFPERQIALLQTFAEQAVIAIENVRLFNETQEALEQQIATGEILQAISRSPGNLQPVFDTLVRAAARFCGAPDIAIMRLDNGMLHSVAATGPFAEVLKRETGSVVEAVVLPVNRDSVSGRAVSDRRTVHVHDLAAEPDAEYPVGHEMQRRYGHRTTAATPLLREGEPLGVMVLFRTEVRPFSDRQLQLLRIFADQAVIAIENVRLFRELESRNRDLVEALEQQTATSDILRVISRSPTDVQPVFETIVKAALSLCRAHSATVLTYDGEMLHVGARLLDNATPEEFDAIRGMFPRPPGRDTAAGRAILTRRIVVIPDVLEDADYEDKGAAIRGGFRSAVAVPLMRDGIPIGTINIGLRHSGAFPDKQLMLLQTFADQAVIAIENVRLFKELEARNRDLTEALEQQTATGEILSVISRSPTDVQPVFDTIANSALKLCGASSVNVFTFDGELMRIAALVNVSPEGGDAMRRIWPRPPGRDNASGRAVLTGSLVQMPDVLEDPEFAYKPIALHTGFRSVLSLPLMRDGRPIGAITVGRPEAGSFPDKQIALLRTFADQAVIAIENVRLFKELEARNRDLTETLEQQTATSEILRVISRSPTDVQPVFDTIAAAAWKLCGASSANVFTFDGELVHLAALVNLTPEGADAIRSLWPRKLNRDLAATRAILSRSVVAIPDVLEDREFARGTVAVAGNFRSILSVPLMREGTPLGAIAVGRPEAGPFPETQIALLQTFADQAVIAIENVRLFKELEVRNRDLTEALEQQTATSEILSVISKSQTDVQPVFDTIAKAARELCRATAANVFTYDGELVHAVAVSSPNPQYVETIHQIYPRRPGRDTGVARAIQSCSVVMIPDVLADEDYVVALGAHATAGGFRSVLAVPLMREGRAVGGIAVGRAEPGPFPDAQVALLKTFADQAVIAIENMRLFKALEARNRDLTEALEQQTATSEILRVISQSPTDVQPVFDAIAAAALKLCGGVTTVAKFDGQLVDLVALASWEPEVAEANRRLYPRPPSRETAVSRAILTRDVVNIADVQQDPEYAIPQIARAAGVRSLMAVPLMREGKPVGAIGVGRPEAGAFTDKQIALLQTFADQAVIAIENVRLFNELEVRNRDLTEALEHQTATSEILRVISGSPTDIQPVFETIGERATKLCDAEIGVVSRLEGDRIQLVSLHGVKTSEGMEAIRRYYPMRLDDETTSARCIRRRTVIHMADVLADPAYAPKDAAVAGGYRGVLAVPMFREAEVIGAIFVARAEPVRFADSKIELLKTFADQAVIAIENVRLFNETKAALERQTATSDVLEAISSAQTDASPVFNTIARNAHRLSGALRCNVLRYDGRLLHIAACCGFSPQDEQELRKRYPVEPGDASVMSGRVILSARIEQIDDTGRDPLYDQQHAEALGLRRMLGVPMLREGTVLGVIVLAWSEPGQTPAALVDLLETFADQAVIAIENVRLFNELKARTAQLTRSVGELKALGEVGQAVASTLDLGTVLRTIVSHATHLAGMDGGSIWEYDEAREEFHLHETDRLPEELVNVLRSTPIRKGEGALGRLAVTGEPVEIRDFVDDSTYKSRLRNVLIRTGFRSVLAAPLLRDDHLLGALAVNRKVPGSFDPQTIELLKTFATQSALAIQNARLFREIEVKSRELETASRHKSEFLANMSHELRTPLNAIIGFSEVLAEKMFGEINEKQSEYVADILESGRHLLSLINDILDLSKIEAGRMELEPSDFDLPGAIENALILVRERAQRRAIKLAREVDERLGKVRGDERKVKQVLLNLLSNALKFTPEGGRIDVRATARDGVAEISVSDTGVGIAPEDQEAVFEEFKQVGTASKKVEGTGLGLAISRKFIELHGGRMWVESQPGKGATFSFTLPHGH